MKKRILPLILALCLPLSGCAFLLERSYSSVEPYTDRYWDSGAEDTLKAESYQDLVNSLLMLIEQRSEEVVIRYYAPDGTDSYAQAVNAKHEVQNETLLGSYLLSSLSVVYSNNDGYCTLTYHMTYREDAQDISTLMALTDSQSLVDLLRLAVREGHTSLTAQFISKVSRDEVMDAVNRLWQELYLDELEASGALDPQPPEDEESDDTVPPEDGEDTGSGEENGNPEDETESEEDPETGEDSETEGTTEEGGESESGDGSEAGGDAETGEDPETGEPQDEPVEPVIEFPPCPWTIIFYPNANTAEIVEIVLK